MTQDGNHVSLSEITPTLRGQIDHLSDYWESELSDCAGSPAPDASVTRVNEATGEYPSREVFAGPYEFSVEIDASNNSQKRSWEYSAELKKLYIKMACFVPMQIKINSDAPNERLKVRAILVYDTDGDFSTPVDRCPVHRDPSHKSNIEFPNYPYLLHVLSCKHRDAVYEVNEHNNRHSVVVPLDQPQPGCSYSTWLYGMMCKSSCIGGMNRRNTSIIFTLEENCEVKGRQVLKVRVCSCPKRDMKQDIEQNQEESAPRIKKRKVMDNKVKMEKSNIVSHAKDVIPIPAPEQHHPLPYINEMLYVEVGNLKHYRHILKRAMELYRTRVNVNIAMYDRLLRDADQQQTP